MESKVVFLYFDSEGGEGAGVFRARVQGEIDVAVKQWEKKNYSLQSTQLAVAVGEVCVCCVTLHFLSPTQ